MFTIRYPQRMELEKLIRKMTEQSPYAAFISHLTTDYTPQEEHDVETNSKYSKFVLDFPGISPERISTKLQSDRTTIKVYVDGLVQKTITLYTPVSAEDISVNMEHGRLTLRVFNTPKKAATESEIELPLNGKQFLQD